MITTVGVVALVTVVTRIRIFFPRIIKYNRILYDNNVRNVSEVSDDITLERRK